MASCKLNKIFDPIRKREVRATPEEIIRQTVIQKMIGKLGFPAALMAVERELASLCEENILPQRRIDIVSFTKEGSELFPLLLIECKKEVFSNEALDQLLGYNVYLRAPFIALAAKDRFSLVLTAGKKRQFFSDLPPYVELLRMKNGL